MKTNILADFQIFISVTLNGNAFEFLTIFYELITEAKSVTLHKIEVISLWARMLF